MSFNLGKLPGNKQKWTEKRRLEIEQIFQDNKAAIKADLDNLELAIYEIEKKWGVHNRTVRQWLDRFGIDPHERTTARKRAGYDKKAKPSRAGKKYVQEAKPQAHKLLGLW